MKKHKYAFVLLILIGCLGTGTSQINFNANAGGGTMQMTGNYDHYFIGYRFHTGLTLDGPIPIAEDLFWESGVETALGQAKFYRMARGSHSGVNGEVPLDKSQKLTHTFWFLDVPVRVRYNAFGFMGLMVGVNLSYLLDRKVYYPDLDKSLKSYWEQKTVATAEAGLFFPVTDRIRIDVKGYKALDGRFYLSRSTNESGKIVKGSPYSDFGFLVNVAYKLNR